MKRLKKALSLLLAGAITVTSLLCGSVTASAASGKKALVSIAVSKIDKNMTGVGGYLGQDLYALTNPDTGKEVVYRIDSAALKNWRKTGKLNAKKITVTSDINGHFWYFNELNSFRQGNYAVVTYMATKDTERSIALKYDKSKGTITQYYASSGLLGSTSDGYLSDFLYDDNSRKLTLKIIDPNGKTVKKITRDLSECDASWATFYGNKNKIMIASWQMDEETYTAKNSKIEFIDKKGNVTKTIKDINLTRTYAGINYLAYAPWTDIPSSDYLTDQILSDVYYMDKDKTYSLEKKNYMQIMLADSGEVQYLLLYGLGNKLYGTKAIAIYTDGAEEPTYKYALIDITKEMLPSFVSYQSMTTDNDGKTYLVNQNGYTDSNGDLLETFDDAGTFYGKGKYAPVIKNGKIYLINAKMKQISKTIKANSDSWVLTLSDNVFSYSDGKKEYLMTYK